MKAYKWYEAIELARKEARVFVNDRGERLSWSNFSLRAVVTDGNIEWDFIARAANLDFDWYDSKEYIDWSKVAVDTKVLVRDWDEQEWLCRYFAKYENGQVYTWFSGGTSWSNPFRELAKWKQVKLYNEDEAND